MLLVKEHEEKILLPETFGVSIFIISRSLPASLQVWYSASRGFYIWKDVVKIVETIGEELVKLTYVIFLCKYETRSLPKVHFSINVTRTKTDVLDTRLGIVSLFFELPPYP